MNITLIGMPGSGKSTVGRYLAQRTGMRFVDVDKVIIREEGRTLADIIAQDGNDGFRIVENRVNAHLQAERTVIAPGGSVIYGEDAMRHLREISRVIYLQINEKELLERLGDLTARGVSILPGMTFHDLYEERCPLYEKYAHLTICTTGKTLYQVVSEIRRRLKL